MSSDRRRLGTLLITGDGNDDAVASRVERALALGCELVQLRRRDRPGREVERLARRLVGLASARGKILVNDRLDVALSAGAAGVHLPGGGFSVRDVRRMVPPGFVIARSTHRVEEVRRAYLEGASLVVFGPIFPTASKPGHPGVGLGALADAVRAAPIPVYALGGMTCDRVPLVAAAGAEGIAGISMFESDQSLRALFERLGAEGA
jgi:thiamine-phosphate pyrophosphorylase